MNIKTGTDIVYIPEFSHKLDNLDFMQRIFTPEELTNPDPTHLAGLFAAKEAFFKATQAQIKHWHQITITHEKNGKPKITHPPNLVSFKILSQDCSISHHQDYATATVVILHN